MKSSAGFNLQADIKSAHVQGKKVLVYVTGHSLGGAASQILSLHLSRYFRLYEKWGKSTVKVQNFSFNTPRAGDTQFAKLFAREIKTGYMASFNFTNAGDPISIFQPKGYPGICVDPNGTNNIIEGNVNEDVGYCVHKEFGAIEPGFGDMSNHAIEKMIGHLDTASQWSDHIACMKKGFVGPSWVN